MVAVGNKPKRNVVVAQRQTGGRIRKLPAKLRADGGVVGVQSSQTGVRKLTSRVQKLSEQRENDMVISNMKKVAATKEKAAAAKLAAKAKSDKLKLVAKKAREEASAKRAKEKQIENDQKKKAKEKIAAELLKLKEKKNAELLKLKEKKNADRLLLRQQREQEKLAIQEQNRKDAARRQKDAQISREEKRLSDLRNRIAKSLAPPEEPDPDKIQCECGGSYSAKQYWGAFYDSARISHVKTKMHQIWLDTGKRSQGQGKVPPDYRLKNAERCECGIFIPMKRMVYGKMKDDWQYKSRHVKSKVHQEYLELEHLL